MKTLGLILLGGVLMFSCGKGNISSSQRQKTPSNLVMTHDEKMDVNYDARENHKIINNNLTHKDAKLKAADKQRKKNNEELNKLNQSTSKVAKKKKTHEFKFY